MITAIAPDISLNTILMGGLALCRLQGLAILILSLFPGHAAWMPTGAMGVGI